MYAVSVAQGSAWFACNVIKTKKWRKLVTYATYFILGVYYD